MPDFFKDKSDEWWLEFLTPLYSRLDVQIDIHVVQALRRAYEAYIPGSSVLTTVTEISEQTRVPWYKFFIFFAYAFGRADSMFETLFNSKPGEPTPPS
jgi:hypothetical protein